MDSPQMIHAIRLATTISWRTKPSARGSGNYTGNVVAKNGGRACKPDSVPHANQKQPACAAIIPLGHGSHRDSSSLPEGSHSRRLAPSRTERVHFHER